MDQTDIKLLEILQNDARTSLTDMGKIVGLTSPSVGLRVKRMEQVKIIRRYVALLNAKLVNRHITALVSVTLDKYHSQNAFIDRIQRIPEVMECYHVTGDMDYVLKVRTTTTASLEAIIVDEIRALDGVKSTRTSMILSVPKEETRYEVTLDDVCDMKR